MTGDFYGRGDIMYLHIKYIQKVEVVRSRSDSGLKSILRKSALD